MRAGRPRSGLKTPSLRAVLEWVLLVSVLGTTLVPLVVTEPLVFPFMSGKGHLLRLLVALAVACWAVLAIDRPELRPRSSPILLALATFVVVLGLADVVGVWPARSLLGNLERMEGWQTHLHLLGLFLVLPAALTSERLWRRYFQTSLGVSVVVTAVAFAQLGGLVVLHGEHGRIDGTLGNPSFLAAYLAFHIWLAALLATDVSTAIHLRRVYWVVATIEAAALFFTATRSAILGVVAGATVTAVLVLVVVRGRAPVRRLAAMVVAAVVLAGVGLVVFRDTEVVTSSPVLSRFAAISPSELTSQARLLAWRMALEGAAERPWLGWGQECTSIVYARYYDPRLYTQDPFFDRIHNVFLQWLLAAGVPGLLVFGGVLAAFMVAVWRGWTFDPLERCLLTGLAAGYAVHASFLFDTVTSFVLGVAMLAWVHWRITTGRSGPDTGADPHRRRWQVLAVAMVVVAASSAVLSWRAVAAELALRAAVQSDARGAEGSLEAFRRALRHRTPATWKARERILTTAVAMARSSPEASPAVAELAELGWREMDRQIRECPLDVRSRVTLASTLWRFSAFDEAESLLAQAHALAPHMQHVLFELGTLRLERGRMEEALAAFRAAYELEPSWDEARRRYAAAAVAAGRRDLADELLAPEGGLDGASNEWLIAALRATGDRDALVGALERRIAVVEAEGDDPTPLVHELDRLRRVLDEEADGQDQRAVNGGGRSAAPARGAMDQKHEAETHEPGP